jgi:SAM-dependent methyltransferase
VFDAVISNHSLEHFVDAESALREIGRVLQAGGALYIAVPDASTFTDKLYRWLARGGGHVNAYTSARQVIDQVTALTGLPYAGGRLLYTSFSFLYQREAGRVPRRMILVGNGRPWVLRWATYLFRQLRPSLSWYGWALYFGTIREPVETLAWTNVCIRCGSGHPSAWLEAAGAVRRQRYRCPQCGTENLFTRDEDLAASSPVF